MEVIESDQNLITKFFNRPQHQAYEYRARQDAVQKVIGDQFAKTMS